MRVEQTDEYRRWFTRLKDQPARARILVRVDRLIHGNPGLHRNLTDGVSELKIDVRPAYRVDYTQRSNRLLLLLLTGGDEASQRQDIATAIRLADQFKESAAWTSQLRPRPGTPPRPRLTT